MRHSTTEAVQTHIQVTLRSGGKQVTCAFGFNELHSASQAAETHLQVTLRSGGKQLTCAFGFNEYQKVK